MKWLLRPTTLVVLSVVLALVAGLLWWRTAAVDPRPQPRPVADDEQEVVWLYAATNPAAWERFVTGVGTAVDRLQKQPGGLAVHVDSSNAFPPQTTAVPELSVSVDGAPGRLVFRWYKLTSEWKIHDWVQALLARSRPPLAIIGGSSSDLAFELADQLQEQSARLGKQAPLLLITTATTVDLERHYPGRTFRFCFNNQRMAEAVTNFIWDHQGMNLVPAGVRATGFLASPLGTGPWLALPIFLTEQVNDLRPDRDPVSVAIWDDDPYSEDLWKWFDAALVLSAAQADLRDLVRAADGSLGSLLTILGSWQSNPFRCQLRATPQHIFSSVGSFDQPNREEALAAEFLIGDAARHPEQRRPLLVLPAQTQPSRRFLKALMRTAPRDARRFVVATGDALAFNTIYRDRDVAWQIQDLPYDLVLFCHRNPVDDQAGFQVDGEHRPGTTEDGALTASGTEDLLLNVDIVEALICAGYERPGATGPGPLVDDPTALAERLRQARVGEGGISFSADGPLLFDNKGDRRSGTGEHIVHLHPTRDPDGLIQPEATISVWYWEADGSQPGRWRLRRELAQVPYIGRRAFLMP